MFVSNLLEGQRILVTGGGSGLGRSFALRFAELGAQVFICGRRLEALGETVGMGAEGAIIPLACDIRDADAIEAMFDEIWKTGPLTGLVNNAAANFVARSETLSARAFETVTRIVLLGTANCTIAAGRRWIADGVPGSVLSIISGGAFSGRAFTAPSAAAKAGVLALMKSLAVEWGRHGIRTVAVSPGLFPTPGAWKNLSQEGRQGETRKLENQVPLHRLGDHIEIANLCAYLMAPGAGYISGESVTIDGGWSLQEGGGAMIRHLFDWNPEDWDNARAGK